MTKKFGALQPQIHNKTEASGNKPQAEDSNTSLNSLAARLLKVSAAVFGE